VPEALEQLGCVAAVDMNQKQPARGSVFSDRIVDQAYEVEDQKSGLLSLWDGHSK
jgi:hypothetical protein